LSGRFFGRLRCFDARIAHGLLNRHDFIRS
jgi:hypothetical protein